MGFDQIGSDFMIICYYIFLKYEYYISEYHQVHRVNDIQLPFCIGKLRSFHRDFGLFSFFTFFNTFILFIVYKS